MLQYLSTLVINAIEWLWRLKDKYNNEYSEGQQNCRSSNDMSVIYFLKLKSLSNVSQILRTVRDGVMLWVRMFVGRKRVSLLCCLDVSIMMKYVLLAFSLSFVVCHPAKCITETITSCLRERSMSAVDKYMYTWVSSAYKWWSNLWLWIRELIVVWYTE